MPRVIFQDSENDSNKNNRLRASPAWLNVFSTTRLDNPGKQQKDIPMADTNVSKGASVPVVASTPSVNGTASLAPASEKKAPKPREAPMIGVSLTGAEYAEV